MPVSFVQAPVLYGFDPEIQEDHPFDNVWSAGFVAKIYTNEQSDEVRRFMADPLALQELKYANNVFVLFRALRRCGEFWGQEDFWRAMAKGYSTKPSWVKELVCMLVDARKTALQRMRGVHNSPTTHVVDEFIAWLDQYGPQLTRQNAHRPTDPRLFSTADSFFSEMRNTCTNCNKIPTHIIGRRPRRTRISDRQTNQFPPSRSSTPPTMPVKPEPRTGGTGWEFLLESTRGLEQQAMPPRKRSGSPFSVNEAHPSKRHHSSGRYPEHYSPQQQHPDHGPHSRHSDDDEYRGWHQPGERLPPRGPRSEEPFPPRLPAGLPPRPPIAPRAQLRFEKQQNHDQQRLDQQRLKQQQMEDQKKQRQLEEARLKEQKIQECRLELQQLEQQKLKLERELQEQEKLLEKQRLEQQNLNEQRQKGIRSLDEKKRKQAEESRNRLEEHNKLEEQKRLEEEGKQAQVQKQAAEAQKQTAAQKRLDKERKRAEAQKAEQAQKQAKEQKKIDGEREKAEAQKQAEAQKRLEEECKQAEARKQAEEAQKRIEEQQRLEEQRRLEEERTLAEHKKLEEERKLAEQKKLEEERKAEEERQRQADERQRKLEEQKRLDEERKQNEARKQAEENLKRLKEQRKLEEQRKRAEAQKQAEEQKRLEEERKQAEAHRRAEVQKQQEAQRRLEEQKRLEEERRQAETRKKAEEARRELEEQRKREAQKQADDQRRAEVEKQERLERSRQEERKVEDMRNFKRTDERNGTAHASSSTVSTVQASASPPFLSGFRLRNQLEEANKHSRELQQYRSQANQKGCSFNLTREGILLWKGRLIVPNCSLRMDVIHECHLGPAGVHFARQKTGQLLFDKYHWPGMEVDMNRFLDYCPGCNDRRPEVQDQLKEREERPPKLKGKASASQPSSQSFAPVNKDLQCTNSPAPSHPSDAVVPAPSVSETTGIHGPRPSSHPSVLSSDEEVAGLRDKVSTLEKKLADTEGQLKAAAVIRPLERSMSKFQSDVSTLHGDMSILFDSFQSMVDVMTHMQEDVICIKETAQGNQQQHGGIEELSLSVENVKENVALVLCELSDIRLQHQQLEKKVIAAPFRAAPSRDSEALMTALTTISQKVDSLNNEMADLRKEGQVQRDIAPPAAANPSDLKDLMGIVRTITDNVDMLKNDVRDLKEERARTNDTSAASGNISDSVDAELIKALFGEQKALIQSQNQRLDRMAKEISSLQAQVYASGRTQPQPKSLKQAMAAVEKDLQHHLITMQSYRNKMAEQRNPPSTVLTMADMCQTLEACIQYSKAGQK